MTANYCTQGRVDTKSSGRNDGNLVGRCMNMIYFIGKRNQDSGRMEYLIPRRLYIEVSSDTLVTRRKKDTSKDIADTCHLVMNSAFDYAITFIYVYHDPIFLFFL